MEIKTCEQYVLNELNKAQEDAEQAKGVANDLQRILYTLQGYLELFVDEEGSLSMEVDPSIEEETEVKNLLIQLFGRGKYPTQTTDAENNVEA